MELSGVGCSMRTKFLDTRSQLKSAGASLFSSQALRHPPHRPRPPPLRLNSSRKPAYDSTICRTNGRGGKRRPVGKSVEQKQKEFVVKKEALLRKSRGEVSVAEESRMLGEEGNVALLLSDGEGGAISVSSLPPIDEEFRPVATLSVRNSSRYRPKNAQSLDDISLVNGFSKLVVQNAVARENGKESAVVTLNEDRMAARRGLDNRNGPPRSTVMEHTVTRRVEKKQELPSRMS